MVAGVGDVGEVSGDGSGFGSKLLVGLDNFNPCYGRANFIPFKGFELRHELFCLRYRNTPKLSQG